MNCRHGVAWLAVMVAVIFLLAPRMVSALEATNKGLGVNARNMGSFSLEYPVVNIAGKDHKPLSAKSEGKQKAVLKYVDGLEVTVTIKDGEATMAFVNVPAGLKKFTMSMFI